LPGLDAWPSFTGDTSAFAYYHYDGNYVGSYYPAATLVVECSVQTLPLDIVSNVIVYASSTTRRSDYCGSPIDQSTGDSFLATCNQYFSDNFISAADIYYHPTSGNGGNVYEGGYLQCGDVMFTGPTLPVP
jgi:hypothetical protein